MYPLGYYPHNLHFIWLGSTMGGQRKLALDAARRTAAAVASATPEQLPSVQGFMVVPYFAMIRFGMWDEILAEAPPKYDSLFTRGIAHFARGTALAGKGRLEAAQQELAALRKIVADPELAKAPQFSLNTPAAILRIAPDVLAGDIAARRKEYDVAIAHFERAIRHEDALVYNEPPDWHAPVRHWLGAVLLDAGRPAEAEVVYWEDLRRNRDNGWSLFGLHKALAAQDRKDEAAAAQDRFTKAWARSDVTLTASRF
jgi:tetratricopeptide (TPR) repeat protein